MKKSARPPGDGAFRRTELAAEPKSSRAMPAPCPSCAASIPATSTAVDVAITGIPFDQAVTNRPGTRFGPEAIRKASAAARLGSVSGRGSSIRSILCQSSTTAIAISTGAGRRMCQAHRRPCRRDHRWRRLAGELRRRSLRHLSAAARRTPKNMALCRWCTSTPTAMSSPTRAAVSITAPCSTRHSRRLDRPEPLDPDRHSHHLSGRAHLRHSTSSTPTGSCDRAASRSRRKSRRWSADHPAYLTFDIDCLDPAFAPGTGTPVPGGLSSHQALSILRGLKGVNFVGMDVVEVSPAYDHAEITALAGATIALEYSASGHGRKVRGRRSCRNDSLQAFRRDLAQYQASASRRRYQAMAATRIGRRKLPPGNGRCRNRASRSKRSDWPRITSAMSLP